MAREYLRLRAETTFGTYHSASTPIYIELTDSNAFDMRPNPIMVPIRSVSAWNRKRKIFSAKTEIKGGLSTLVYPSQAVALTGWLMGSGTADLPSMTADHAIVMEDGANTTVYSRYLGTRVEQADFTCSEADEPLKLKLALQAKSTATIVLADFAEPAITDYPSDNPYLWSESTGAVTINSTVRDAGSFSCSVKNMLDPRWFNSIFLKFLKYTGRDIDWSAELPYVTAADRTTFEAVTAIAGLFVFTSGANTLTFDAKSANFYGKVTDNLAMDKLFLQNIDASNLLDTVAGTDCTISAT